MYPEDITHKIFSQIYVGRRTNKQTQKVMNDAKAFGLSYQKDGVVTTEVGRRNKQVLWGRTTHDQTSEM